MRCPAVRPFLVIAIAAVTCLAPARAHAQLKQAQERGWTNLKEAYALIVSMRDNKSNRTRSNYETALGRLLTSMADMSPYIDRMGERVADEERSWVAGIRDNTRTALRAMIDPYERLKRAVETNRDSSDKLAELSDEIERMKLAIEAFEGACRGAFMNYTERWDTLKRAMDELDSNAKSTQSRVDSLQRTNDDLYRQEAALIVDREKALEENRKLDRMADDALALYANGKRARDQAYLERNSSNYARYNADVQRARDVFERVVESRIAIIKRIWQLDADIDRKEQERVRTWKDMMPYVEQAGVLEARFLGVFGRWVLWDTEFPARDYRFMTLR